MKKMRFSKIFLFFLLQGWFCLTSCFSEPPDFLDQENAHVSSSLRRDIKIPVGVHDNALQHIALPAGTPLHEIPFKISQKRTEVGLSPDIPLSQQNEFFQNFRWQTTRDAFVKSPLPGILAQVYVHSGQRMNQGDPLCTIECMKMQVLIRAPSSGETTHVFLEEEQVVEQDSMLIAFLPPSPPWEDINQSQILDNKDLLVALFPWAAATLPSVDNDPSPPDGGGNEVSSEVSDDETNLLLQPVPALPLEVTSVPQPMSIVPEFIPGHQSNVQLPHGLLETVILPPQKIEEVLVPPSQNSVLAGQTLPSLPVPQVAYASKAELQKEASIITPPLITKKDVYDSIIEDKQSPSSEVRLFPNNQIALYVAWVTAPPVEARDDGFEARDSKTLSKIKNAVVESPHRGRGNPMILRTSLPTSQASYASQNENEVSLSPSNESDMLIPKVPLNSKHIIQNDHKEIALDETWDISSSTGVKWLYGLIGVSLLLFARKTKFKSLPFSYYHSVDYNRHVLITHYLAANVNFRERPKDNALLYLSHKGRAERA